MNKFIISICFILAFSFISTIKGQTCSLEPSVSYTGTRLNAAFSLRDTNTCCTICRNTPGCVGWTLDWCCNLFSSITGRRTTSNGKVI